MTACAPACELDAVKVTTENHLREACRRNRLSRPVRPRCHARRPRNQKRWAQIFYGAKRTETCASPVVAAAVTWPISVLPEAVPVTFFAVLSQ